MRESGGIYTHTDEEDDVDDANDKWNVDSCRTIILQALSEAFR